MRRGWEEGAGGRVEGQAWEGGAVGKARRGGQRTAVFGTLSVEAKVGN